MSKIVKSSQDIVLFGRQKEIKYQILQAVSTHRTIWNKDVGQILGLPVADAQRPKRQDRILNIVYKSREKPPWKINGENAKSVSYHVPYFKKGVSWGRLKQVFLPFTWGEYRATATMKSGRQMAVYCSTKEEGVKLLRLWQTISEDEILRIRVSDDIQVEPEKIKNPLRYYPCYATVISEPTDLDGKPRAGKRAYKKNRRRVDLYREPEDKSALN